MEGVIFLVTGCLLYVLADKAIACSLVAMPCSKSLDMYEVTKRIYGHIILY